MEHERMLSVIAICRAYATCDAEGLEMLVRDAPAQGYSDLLAFVVMVLEFHTGRPAVGYLDQMANGLLGAAYDEIARSN